MTACRRYPLSSADKINIGQNDGILLPVRRICPADHKAHARTLHHIALSLIFLDFFQKLFGKANHLNGFAVRHHRKPGRTRQKLCTRDNSLDKIFLILEKPRWTSLCDSCIRISSGRPYRVVSTCALTFPVIKRSNSLLL